MDCISNELKSKKNKNISMSYDIVGDKFFFLRKCGGQLMGDKKLKLIMLKLDSLEILQACNYVT
jgi:hypothetical protein